MGFLVDATLTYPLVVPLPFRLGRREKVIDDDALDVAAFRAGDESAFESLVHRREREIHALALRILGDRDDAMDATQEVFLRAFRALPSFRGDASFRTWLTGIAINVCRTRLASRERRERRRNVPLEPVHEEEGERRELPVPDPAPGPEEQALGAELRSALTSALARISLEHREIIVLREVFGMEYDEIAAATRCPVGTVKSRLARARAALREALEGTWP